MIYTLLSLVSALIFFLSSVQSSFLYELQGQTTKISHNQRRSLAVYGFNVFIPISPSHKHFSYLEENRERDRQTTREPFILRRSIQSNHPNMSRKDLVLQNIVLPKDKQEIRLFFSGNVSTFRTLCSKCSNRVYALNEVVWHQLRSLCRSAKINPTSQIRHVFCTRHTSPSFSLRFRLAKYSFPFET